MKIELLYFKGCSHWEEALEELRDLLGAKGVGDGIGVIRVSSNDEAERLYFPGSPTIRINGEDVEPEAISSGFRLACRVYEVEGEFLGRPPKEWLDAALDQAIYE